MRALAVAAFATLLACNQDSASSNAERDTHMGDIRAAAQAWDGAPGASAAAAPVLGAPAAPLAPAVASESASTAPPVNTVASASAQAGDAAPAGSALASPGRGQDLPDAAAKKKNP